MNLNNDVCSVISHYVLNSFGFCLLHECPFRIRRQLCKKSELFLYLGFYQPTAKLTFVYIIINQPLFADDNKLKLEACGVVYLDV